MGVEMEMQRQRWGWDGSGVGGGVGRRDGGGDGNGGGDSSQSTVSDKLRNKKTKVNIMPGLANSSSQRPKVSPVCGENTLARHCSLGPDCAESLKGMKATYLCRTGTMPLDIDCESEIILMVFLPQPVTHTF